MLDEEEGKVVIEDEEELPRSILKKPHRHHHHRKGSLCRRICNYLRTAWTGVKFSLEAEVEEGEPLPPRARPESLKSLTRVTRFTEAELKRIYRGFKAECPSGLVKEDTFRCIYSQFFPQGANSSQYATYVFHTLDQANTGTLSFQDLVRGLSVLCRGSVEERLKWTFTLYDINKDGKITREELADVITSVYNLLGRLSPLQCDEDHETLASKIDVIFQRLDQNNDGVVTWEEFLEACTADETITSSMAVFDSAI
ncbi:EFh [Nesidiocoris tenuis]|uniref:EFh n=1 Tax=Nesidiocoris tenuis TaxID=355587 RepID=A0ABN7BDA3_9HEMI|nr:EFh [Nesidiocoris tenuis]